MTLHFFTSLSQGSTYLSNKVTGPKAKSYASAKSSSAMATNRLGGLSCTWLAEIDPDLDLGPNFYANHLDARSFRLRLNSSILFVCGATTNLDDSWTSSLEGPLML